MFDLNEDNRSKTTFVKKVKIEGGGVPNILRLVDYEKPVTFFESWIICDDGEKRPFILGQVDSKGASKWNVLLEIVGDPLKWYQGGILHSRKADDGSQDFVWSRKAPEVFNMVKYNDDLTEASGGWAPKQMKAWECITRGTEKGEDGVEYNYCVKNNKMQILAISSFLAKDLKVLEENSGNPDEFDINIVKTGSGKTGTRYTIAKIEKTKSPLVVVGGLTDAEKAYARVDKDAAFAPTSAADILKYLEKKITKVSEAMGIDFIGKLYAETGTQASAPVSAPASKQSAPDSDDANIPFTQSGKPLPTRVAAQPQQPAQPQVTLDVKMIPCMHCGQDIPETAQECPHCKNIVAGPCSACGVVSSLTLTECPNCHVSFA